MNGLRYIRKQCNFSLSQLAERLEVSRQIISAWENGKKEIPEMRKKQLADFLVLTSVSLMKYRRNRKEFC